ncbi:XRE family transcriptional regulator [Halobacillus trueperi]|uniref:XRE family transcriptional regulator n=1 Tax=Halobacillus trueperi TaxID=156205 RepID=A0A3D8VIE8_9BACI|nr:helix-turn-helix transcriptional regulator [Halobacillus trueperi]RDY69103.1 XRE family transcriptional regulator [Halobacillus trueperi]
MLEKKVDLQKIKEIRKSKHMSIEEMSTILGYDSPNGYFYLESGKSKFPAEKLAMVSKILDVPIQKLFFEVKVAKMETFHHWR